MLVMNYAFWLMFANQCITAYVAFTNMKENKTLRQERSELLRKNCDLQDEIHHLRVKYGEIPVTCYIVGDTNE